MWEKKIFEKGKGKKGPIIGKGKAKERPKLLSFATLPGTHSETGPEIEISDPEKPALCFFREM